MSKPSEQCVAVLRLLTERHNVLIAGPPGTGKSRLLAEVAEAFRGGVSTAPVFDPDDEVAIPAVPPSASALKTAMPSSARADRQVFRTVFHQNAKYRDFVTGIIPVVQQPAPAKGGPPLPTAAFRVSEGVLFRAAEHAKKAKGASLVIIDEINRGPAVQIFGGSIVAIEGDKRLAPDGTVRPGLTHGFDVLMPGGDTAEYQLPHHVYLLAAMNQADTSVEPLDVAFLRRWAPFKLDPSEVVLRGYFKLAATSPPPPQATTSAHVYEAAVQAWTAANDRVRLGRGGEFRLGHGALMRDAPPVDLDGALRLAAEGWNIVRAHVDEVFFGDVRGVAAVLNVTPDMKSHPYKIEDRDFADEPRLDLIGPEMASAENVYAILRAVAGAK